MAPAVVEADRGISFVLRDGRRIEINEPKRSNSDSKVQAWVGSHVWDSAIRLSNYLDSDYIPSGTLVGKTVCEVGAGTGLAGLVAAALGAEVTLTDMSMALDFLKENAGANAHHFAHRPAVSELVWGKDHPSLGRLSPHKYDIILAAECLYLGSMVRPLLHTMRALCHDNSVVLFCGIIGASPLEMFMDEVGEMFAIRRAEGEDPATVPDGKAVWVLTPLPES